MRKQAKLVAVLSAASLLAIGASMTAFAATPHWDMEDGEWVYLDRNGDKVTDVWKKSNGQWYYLDGDGYMAKDQVIEDDEDKYYVGLDGARVANRWVEMDNDDFLDDDDEPESIDTVYMYFDANGKAVGAGDSDEETVKKLPYGDGQSGYFMFNDEGYMLSGWKKRRQSNGKDDLYYLGTQNEGWARTGWQQLDVDTDLEVFDGMDEDDDGETEWFYFRPNGKAYKDETQSYNGKTYVFDQYGRMLDLWTYQKDGSYTNDASSSSVYTTTSNGVKTTKEAAYYAEDNGGRDKNWVYAYPKTDYEDYDDDQYWFWLTSKGIPFKAGSDEGVPVGAAERIDDDDKSDTGKYSNDPEYSGEVAGKMIKGATYLFNNKGVMLQGLYELDGVYKGSNKMEDGLYFFDTAGYPSSNAGKMVTNKKMKIDVDGEDETYYFSKNGKAYKNAVISSLVYDWEGKLVVDYGDGSTYEPVAIKDIVKDGDDKYELYNKKGGLVFSSTEGDAKVLINGYGRIKTSGECKDVNDMSWNVDKDSDGVITGIIPKKEK